MTSIVSNLFISVVNNYNLDAKIRKKTKKKEGKKVI